MADLTIRLDAHLAACGRRCRIEATQVSLLVAGPPAIALAFAAGLLSGGAVSGLMLGVLGGAVALAFVRCRGEARDWAAWSREFEQGLDDVLRDSLTSVPADEAAAVGREVGALLVRQAHTVPPVPAVPGHADWPHASRLLSWVGGHVPVAECPQVAAFRAALLGEAARHAQLTSLADG